MTTVVALVGPPADGAPVDVAGGVAGSAEPLHRVATVLVGAAIAALAFWIRYRLLTTNGGLGSGGGYDDGVYYAAADALVHGRLPYRDFLFLQPPGIVLVLAPFAWLGSLTSDPHGVVVARMAFLVLGAGNALLVTALARRLGVVAAVVAGVGYAVFFPAAYSERSMLLEPVGSGGLLLALLLTSGALRRNRAALVLAGVALALAATTKVWYVVPALVVVLLLRDRRMLVVAGSAAATAAAVVLPFLLAAPRLFVQEVALDQLGRPRDTSWAPERRLASMLGISTPDDPSSHVAHLILVKLVGLGIIAVVLCMLALSLPEARRFVLLSAVAVVVLLAAPSYFPHYGALLAPTLVLAVAAGIQRAADLLRTPPLQVALLTATLLAAALLNRNLDARAYAEPIPATALRPAAAAVRGCVTSDDPLVLAELNVLSRDLDRGCDVRVDVTGYTYDRDRERAAGVAIARPDDARWQRDIARYLLSGDAVIVHRQATGLSPATSALLRREPVLARSGRWVLRGVQRD